MTLRDRIDHARFAWVLLRTGALSVRQVLRIAWEILRS